MRRIGVISDTHGTFDEPLREFLKDVDEIWHAGDECSGSSASMSTSSPMPPLTALSAASARAAGSSTGSIHRQSSKESKRFAMGKTSDSVVVGGSLYHMRKVV